MSAGELPSTTAAGWYMRYGRVIIIQRSEKITRRIRRIPSEIGANIR